MWRWQKSTEKCQLIDMLQFKKVIFVYKYNILVKSMIYKAVKSFLFYDFTDLPLYDLNIFYKLLILPIN